jgi:hypothetical protein
LAESLGLSRDGYGRKERGEHAFSFDEVVQVAMHLGTSIHSLIDNSLIHSVPDTSDEVAALTASLMAIVDQRVEATLRVRLHEMVNQAIDHHTDRRFAVVAVHEPEAELPHAAEPPAPRRNTGK